MYVDLIIIILLILAVIFYFRRFSSFVYSICAIDLIFRLLHFLADNIKVPELVSLINKYIPSSVLGVIGTYVNTDGVIYLAFMWAMFVIYCIFVFYVIRILFRRR